MLELRPTLERLNRNLLVQEWNSIHNYVRFEKTWCSHTPTLSSRADIGMIGSHASRKIPRSIYLSRRIDMEDT